MVHFPQLASSAGSGSLGEFRRVLHTGLYSQVVAMEIPVGGDIGEEVSLLFYAIISCRETEFKGENNVR